MQGPPLFSIVFVAIAVIFVYVALWDYLKAEGKMTTARKIWIRMAFSYTAVAQWGLAFFIQNFMFFGAGTRIFTDYRCNQ